MDVKLIITLVVVVGMVLGFLSGKFKLGLVAMTATTVLHLTGVLTFNEAYSYMANSNIVLLGALFVLSGALGRTSLVLKLRQWVLNHSGKGQMIVLVYLVICAIMTNLTSPLAILSMLLPFMTALGPESDIQPSHLLYPGAVIGHSCQGALPIGTFFLMVNALLEANGVPAEQMLSVVDYAKIVAVPGIISILYMGFIGWRFFPVNKIDEEQLAGKKANSESYTPLQENYVYIAFILVFVGLFFKSYLPFDVAALAVTAVIVLMYLRVLDLNDVKNFLNLDALFMLVGVMPLGTAMQNTGAGDVVADFIINLLGSNPTPLMILIAFYIAAAFLTQFMSNTATASVFATLAIVTAMSRGIDPSPFAVAIYAGATAAMLSPTSSPSIAIAFGAGHYRIVDVLKACIPLWVIYGAATIFMAIFWYPI